ncbi:MAG: hypothetical protein R3B06_28395 [Kofleriaceae bacterium]
MQRRRLWVLVVAAAVACGGGSSDQDPPGLVGRVASAPAPIDADRAHRPRRAGPGPWPSRGASRLGCWGTTA